MNIFESLKNLNVSERCYDDIMEIVKDIISEVSTETALKVHNKRVENADKAFWDEDEKFQKYANARKELREHPGYKTVGFTPLDKAMDTVNAEKEWEKAKKVKQETRDKLTKNRELMDKRGKKDN